MNTAVPVWISVQLTVHLKQIKPCFHSLYASVQLFVKKHVWLQLLAETKVSFNYRVDTCNDGIVDTLKIKAFYAVNIFKWINWTKLKTSIISQLHLSQLLHLQLALDWVAICGNIYVSSLLFTH